MITSETIQKTESFINTKDKVQQDLILKKDSVKRINYGVSLSTNTSFQRWIEIEHPSERTRQIVSELINISNGK